MNNLELQVNEFNQLWPASKPQNLIGPPSNWVIENRASSHKSLTSDLRLAFDILPDAVC